MPTLLFFFHVQYYFFVTVNVSGFLHSTFNNSFTYLPSVSQICAGVSFHSPFRTYTSTLLGCVHYAVSVEVWSCCTTIVSFATPVHCPGRVSSIPPKDPTASSAKTRTPKSVVGVHIKVRQTYCRLNFEQPTVTWQMSLSKVKTLTRYKIAL